VPNSKNAQPSHEDYYENPEHKDNSTKRPIGAAAPDALPKLRVELVVIDGDEGRKLHALQSQAVFEVLLWLAEHRGDADNSKENA
jgi:hypothetical protein